MHRKFQRRGALSKKATGHLIVAFLRSADYGQRSFKVIDPGYIYMPVCTWKIAALFHGVYSPFHRWLHHYELIAMTYIWITNYDRGLTSRGYCALVSWPRSTRSRFHGPWNSLFSQISVYFERPSESPSSNFAATIVEAKTWNLSWNWIKGD